MPKPLILITNDDGVKSPGLLAAVKALRGLGEIVVVAPREQQSSSGRAFYWRKRQPLKRTIQVGQTRVLTIAVDASPAVSVRYALMLALPRLPDLVVSGINYGENMGSGVTISGTIGAALEAAADGVPALAMSLETDPEYHTSHSSEIDFGGAAYWTRYFAERMVRGAVMQDAPVVNVNVPRTATRDTAWRVTCASHQAYFRSTVIGKRIVGYNVNVDRAALEPDSDIYALLVDRVISVTPLTYDLTARVNAAGFKALFQETLNGRRK